MKNLLFAIQPLFLPWIGFYDMIDKSNTFVLLDDVQFNTRSWQQRNKIKKLMKLKSMILISLLKFLQRK